MAVTHYGWRIKLFTIFPNAISISQVEGPDVFLIPWFNILFFIVVAAILFVTVRAISVFKRMQVDPIVDGIDDFIDDVGENAEQTHSKVKENVTTATSGFRRWLKR